MRKLQLILLVIAIAMPQLAINVTGDKPKAATIKQLSPAKIELAKRYIDELRGFSLRPPVNTTRRRESSPGRLVSWSHRDAKTGAIDMTITVLYRVERNTKIQLEPYSKALASKLRREEQFKAESVKLIKVAGKDAIDLQGWPGVEVDLWQRQVWIWTGYGDFLIIVVSGPKNNSPYLNSVCNTVLNELKIFDPTKALKIRQENLERGKELLEGFIKAKNIKSLEKAFAKEQRWYLLKIQDKDVGYAMIATSPSQRDGTKGYEVRSFIKINMPGDKPAEVKRTQFATADRKLELWQESLIIGAGLRALQTAEEGIKQDDGILCRINRQRQQLNHKKKLKLNVLDIYLPKALGMVLPKLVDLKKKQSYAFAVYNSDFNNFDMRTFTVIGPEKITLQSQEVQAIRANDQMAADEEPAHLWLDASGALLRMKTAEGLIMDTSTRASVIRHFPNDQTKIRALK